VKDNGDSKQPKADRQGYEPRRFKSLVAQLHREAQQRRSRADEQTPHEAALVRVTRWLVVATIALAVAGFLGFGAAILQWSALRSSDEKAGETLGVMQGQLIAIQNATKDTHSGLVDVQRAFITSSELEIDPIHSEDNSVAAWNIKVILENSGSTPARNLRFWGGWNHLMVDRRNAEHLPNSPQYPIEGTGISDPDIEYYANIADLQRFTLGPRTKTKIRLNIVNQDRLKQIAEGTWIVGISMTLQYEDIFAPSGPPHTTKLCYLLGSWKTENGQIYPVWNFCPYWNCIDDDCKADRANYRDAVAKIFQRFGKQVPANFYKPIPPD
jgi:hypothetical protein